MKKKILTAGLTALLFFSPVSGMHSSYAEEVKKQVQTQEYPKETTAEEKKLGEEATKELEKIFSYVDNEENKKLEERLDVIANKIGIVSERKNVVYDVKIVKSKEQKEKEDINAFSIPGGKIYMTEGMVKKIGGDDEFAGVLAHEIAHNENWHVLKYIKAAKKVSKKGFLTGAGLVLVFGKDAIPYAVLTSNLIVTAILNEGYGQKFEAEADNRAVDLCVKAKYNPNGILTFLEYLAALEESKPPIELGIFRTHPKIRERTGSIIAEIEKRKIEINRRITADSLKAEIKDKGIYLKSFSNEIYIFSPAEKTEEYVTALNSLLKENLQVYEIKFKINDRAVFYARNNEILEITGKDAENANKSLEEIANETKKAFQKAFYTETVNLVSGNR